jgi:hypothetical protein
MVLGTVAVRGRFNVLRGYFFQCWRLTSAG